MSQSKRVLTPAHIYFLVAGLLLLIKFLLEGGIPSPSADILSFIVGLFTLVVLVGFYCFFLFGARGYDGTIRSLAPAVLLIVLYGSYSLDFGNADVNRVLVGIGRLCEIIIIVTGFVFLFVHSKLIGLVFIYSSLVYAIFVGTSYAVMAIINAINGGAFSWTGLVSAMLLMVSFGFIFAGGYLITKSKSFAV